MKANVRVHSQDLPRERTVESYPPKTKFMKISKMLPLGLFNLLLKDIWSKKPFRAALINFFFLERLEKTETNTYYRNFAPTPGNSSRVKTRKGSLRDLYEITRHFPLHIATTKYI